MTTFLLIRHGQSVANLDDLFAGIYDKGLTELGHTQAACTARFIADTYPVDRIYSSNLPRAFSTAEHLARLLGLPVTPCPGVREIFAGDWEGRPFAELKQTHPEAYRLWMTDIGLSRCPGGESVEEVAKRVHAALEQIARENEGKTVAVFAHATPIRTMQWHVTGKPLSFLQQVPWVSNASVTELSYADGRFSMVKVSQDAHLQELRTVLPSSV